MPAGLQIFDAGGNLVVDYTTRMSQVLGTLSLGDGHAAGSIAVGSLDWGAPFAAVLGEGRFTSAGQPRIPTRITSISGNTVFYSNGDSCTIVFGIY